MCLREQFGGYRPDLNAPIDEMAGKEIFRQALYLMSGLADERDRKGVSLGLSPEHTARYKELRDHIEKTLDLVCA